MSSYTVSVHLGKKDHSIGADDSITEYTGGSLAAAERLHDEQVEACRKLGYTVTEYHWHSSLRTTDRLVKPITDYRYTEYAEVTTIENVPLPRRRSYP